MRDWACEIKNRVAFLRKALADSGCGGFVLGISGGKDSALVGILCKKACDNTIGFILPCVTKRNYDEDSAHAALLAQQFSIKSRTIDLTPTADALKKELGELAPMAVANISARLRMTALYAAANSDGLLVAGTGNRSEAHVGYFTKYGDGACDINPIADLTVTEIYDFLRYLGAPPEIINKPPSAGLYEGQTDEGEMGLSYAELDNFLLHGIAADDTRKVIDRYHRTTEHKRTLPICYGV